MIERERNQQQQQHVQLSSMDQWKTAFAVTSARVLTVIHFQNTTWSFIWNDLIFDFISKLNTCN
jgi:hypothetical protein